MRGRSAVIHLPERVDIDALEPLVLALARAVAPFVLDFAITDHIDYRAFRRFAGRVRRMGIPERPILLAGLSPYCEEIVRFALGPGDWELFLEIPGEKATSERSRAGKPPVGPAGPFGTDEWTERAATALARRGAGVRAKAQGVWAIFLPHPNSRN